MTLEPAVKKNPNYRILKEIPASASNTYRSVLTAIGNDDAYWNLTDKEKINSALLINNAAIYRNVRIDRGIFSNSESGGATTLSIRKNSPSAMAIAFGNTYTPPVSVLDNEFNANIKLIVSCD